MQDSQHYEPLLDFLHLSSMALPVGGFAYSQGLEQAIESGLITDYKGAKQWIGHCLSHNLVRQECVLWYEVFKAAAENNREEIIKFNDLVFALKETAELRLEARQMGQSLANLFSKWQKAQWLKEINPEPIGWTYTAAHASLCAAVGLNPSSGLTSFLWAWCENQVLCLVKHLPLGQSQGQTLLQEMKPVLEQSINEIMCTNAQHSPTHQPTEFGSATAGFAINSARHETQYSRLFRS
jgi:urease accessory protein